MLKRLGPIAAGQRHLPDFYGPVRDQLLGVMVSTSGFPAVTVTFSLSEPISRA